MAPPAQPTTSRRPRATTTRTRGEPTIVPEPRSGKPCTTGPRPRSIRGLHGRADSVRGVLDAFALGARHGLDADHLAAISELTAGEGGGRCGFVAGVRYALGHAVAVAAIGFAAGAAGLEVPAWVVGATLIGLGAWAAVRLARAHSHEHEHEHVVDGVRVRHEHRHRHAIAVGLVHGLGGAPSAVVVGGAAA